MRTKFDPNEIVQYDEHAEIVLYDRYNREKARAIIDIDSIADVVGTKWYQRPDSYVAANNYKDRGYTYLHSAILSKTGHDIYVDHRDHDRLNNRRANLRIATPSQNGMNKRMRSNNKSGRVGVHWSTSNQKWCAMICDGGCHTNLGYFDDFDAAVACREAAERERFGEFRPK